MVGYRKLIDMSGQRFGMWRVGRQAGNRKGGGGAMWTCTCDCGVTRAVLGLELRRGESTSCGCANVQRLGDLKRSHGASGTRLYDVWRDMHARSKSVGAQSIIVCEAWNDFPNFHQWAYASGFKDSLTLERKDANGNYEPSNCTWVPSGEQAHNQGSAARAPDGELWRDKARKNGIPNAAFRQRVSAGWPVEQACTLPTRSRRLARTKDAEDRRV